MRVGLISILLFVSFSVIGQTYFIKLSPYNSPPISTVFSRIEQNDLANIGYKINNRKYLQSGTVKKIHSNFIVFKNAGLFGKRHTIPIDSITHLQETLMKSGGFSGLTLLSVVGSSIYLGTSLSNSQNNNSVGASAALFGFSVANMLYLTSMQKGIVKRTLEKYNKIGRDWKLAVVQE